VEILKLIADRVIEGDIAEVESLTREAIEQKVNPEKILNEGFMRGLEVVGEKFEAGELFLPEMLTAGMAMKAGMEVVEPLLVKSNVRLKGTIVAGTVVGDIHDIGKNLVCMLFEGAGFKVIDLGVDVPVEKFIHAAKENRADMIAMSALLSTTMANMEDIIQGIRHSELKHRVKVMVGGAPVTQDFADSIGADGYAPDAALAARKAREILGLF